MSRPKGICLECGEEVASVQTATYQIIGYETERDQGGQNHVQRRRRVDGRIWHTHCAERFFKRLDGRGEQGSLV